MSATAMQAFSDSARDLLSRNGAIERLRRLRDADVGFDRVAWQELANAGWLGILVSEDEGGLGLGLREMSAIAQEVGQALLPEPYIAGAVQVATVLMGVPPSALRSQLLEQLVSGSCVAGLAWQEKLGQMQALEVLTAKSVVQNDMLCLSGNKSFVSPSNGADGWIVLAMQQSEPVLVWVPSDSRGLVCEELRGADGLPTCTLKLMNVAVPTDNVLLRGKDALALVDVANDRARVIQSAELLGVMRKALSQTIDYLGTRKQFGQAIGSFQALKHRAVDAYIQVELSASCVEDVLTQIELGGALSALASRAKSRTVYAALLVTRMAIQFHGAMGFTDECDIGLYYKRTLKLSAQLGNLNGHRMRFFQQTAPESSTTAQVTTTEFPSQADWDAMSEKDFRQMLRSFYSTNYPETLRNVPRRLHWHEIKDWYMTLSRQGWVAPAWPKHFGGMGLSPEKMIAYVEEQEQYGVARAPDMGVVMIGPLLIQRGSAAQQQKFLPKIIAGEHIWCQGYSEPGAGSDLASLRTEAVQDGDVFVVNGQKIWTTLAQDATHMFALVRTDKEAKKQAGISFLLIDLATPGITIRPIKDIVGYEEFCEVFFDNVRVPVDNLVGELNQGWTIAKTLLGFERIFLGSPKQSRYAMSQLTAMAEHLELFSDAVFVSRYAELMLDVADQVSGYTHYAEMVKRGDVLPPSVSLLKIWGTDTYQRICALMVEYAQEHGASGFNTELSPAGLNVPAIMLNSIPSTIYGGSTEVQKEILAKHVLKLPD
ncbi:acyl-CoA dehydrogenase [Alcaligenaceae bacterium LF4-65]|uniref:Acyl-CoA dehydrogenase n=1 Tax=Zwartia hollandica TaxID=324606 RepID=A0A953N8W0_9BURK|nr:acyl-CoA dehydrogenase [Zwartia hollandica]MBZ1350695.1 acyl-CoA dehydrogenase [Zwartia hollandica]